MKLKEIAKDLKVGDVFWVKAKISSIVDGEPEEKGGNGRYFNFEEHFPNSLLEAEVYGNNEVFIGEIGSNKVVNKEVEKQHSKEREHVLEGKVEAYEKLLVGREFTAK